MKWIKRTLKYFNHAWKCYFKTRMNRDYKNQEDLYYSHFTNKLWKEKVK